MGLILGAVSGLMRASVSGTKPATEEGTRTENGKHISRAGNLGGRRSAAAE
jgi:hypothetical protein